MYSISFANQFQLRQAIFQHYLIVKRHLQCWTSDNTQLHFSPRKISLEQYAQTTDTLLSQPYFSFVSPQTPIKMDKIKIEPFKIIGISVRTTNENGQAAKDIADLWGRFVNEKIAEAIPNKIDNTVYSLYTDYESDHTKPYTAILGCRVANINDIPNGMMSRSFDGGNYAKLSTKGDLMKGLIVNKWTEIWEMGLDRAFTADFEVFGAKAQNPTDAEIDFLIALK